MILGLNFILRFEKLDHFHFEIEKLDHFCLVEIESILKKLLGKI